MELVGNLLSRYYQHIIFTVCGAPVILVEVHDEGGEIRGFPAYVEDGPCHGLLDK